VRAALVGARALLYATGIHFQQFVATYENGDIYHGSVYLDKTHLLAVRRHIFRSAMDNVTERAQRCDEMTHEFERPLAEPSV
jgi:hypothetical protein